MKTQTRIGEGSSTTSSLLAKLCARRSETSIPSLPDPLVSSLLARRTSMPKLGPAILDRSLMMLLGFDEVQTDVMLVLWEAGGELPLWGDGTVTDLCHELDLTSSTIRHSLKQLEATKIVKVSSKNRALWVKAVSPRKLRDRIAVSFRETSSFVSEFLQKKALEFDENKIIRLPHPETVIVGKEILGNLRTLSTEKKVSYGLLGGNWYNGQLKITKFVRVGCRAGEKIHLMPNWEEFHRTKRSMISSGEVPLVEFHTHPNGRPFPVSADVAKMKMLRLGFWAIGGNGDVRFYQFYHERKPGLKLAVDELRLDER